MKAQVRYETQARGARPGENPRASLQHENRDHWRRFSLSLLGGLLCTALLFSATGQAIAGQPGREVNSPELLAALTAQTREVLAQSHHFMNDLRLLYQISQLKPLETEPVAAPVAAPAEPECKEAETPLRLARFHSARISVNAKLISAPVRTDVLVKLDKARS